MPKQTYNDVLIQSRVKSQTLAIIARYLVIEERVMIAGRSQLVRAALELLEKILVVEKSQPRPSVSEARRILQALGLENLNPQGRGKLNYVRELQLEAFEHEGDWEEFEPGRNVARAAQRVATATATEGCENEPEVERELLDRAEERRRRDREEKLRLQDAGKAPLAE